MQIVPPMIKAGMPLPPDLLTYAPLPTDLIQKWQQYMLKMQSQQVNPQMVQQMQEQMQKLEQQNQQLQLQLKDKSQELQLKAVEVQSTLELKKQEVLGKLQLQADAHNQDMQLQRVTTSHNLALAQQKQQDDTKIKAATAGLQGGDGSEISLKIETEAESIVKALEGVTESFAEALKQIVSSINAPKQVIRDANGNIVGVKSQNG